jgi:hypothetical protein
VSYRDLPSRDALHIFGHAHFAARTDAELRQVEIAHDAYLRARFCGGSWDEADREIATMEAMLAAPAQEAIVTVLPVPCANDSGEAAAE